jgi:hypothetical protein
VKVVKEKINWEEKAVELAALLLEARDALPAITITAAKLHGLDLTLAHRIEDALEIWRDDENGS